MTLWDSVAQVGTGLTLAAFIVASITAVARTQIMEREKLIKSAPEAERADLIRDTLDRLAIDTSNLTREQKL